MIKWFSSSPRDLEAVSVAAPAGRGAVHRLGSLPHDLASWEAKFGSPTAQGGGARPIPDAGGAASLPTDLKVGTARRAVRGCLHSNSPARQGRLALPKSANNLWLQVGRTLRVSRGFWAVVVAGLAEAGAVGCSI